MHLIHGEIPTNWQSVPLRPAQVAIDCGHQDTSGKLLHYVLNDDCEYCQFLKPSVGNPQVDFTVYEFESALGTNKE